MKDNASIEPSVHIRLMPDYKLQWKIEVCPGSHQMLRAVFYWSVVSASQEATNRLLSKQGTPKVNLNSPSFPAVAIYWQVSDVVKQRMLLSP